MTVVPAREEGKRSAPLLKTPDSVLEWARANTGFTSKDYFAKWSNEDLKAALEEGIAKPAFGKNQEALHVLIMEWTRRDPDAAWLWLKQLRSESQRMFLSAGLAMGWPMERAAEGLELAAANPEIFSAGRMKSQRIFIRKAVETAALEGPSRVEEILKALEEEQVGSIGGEVKFPEGFDFRGLFQSAAMLDMLRAGKCNFATVAWMKADPESAFQRLLEVEKGSAPDPRQPLGSRLLMAMSPYVDSDAATSQGEWMGKRIASLDPAEQRAIAMNFATGMRGTPAVLAKFLASMPEGQSRDEAALLAASGVRSDGISAVVAFLDAASQSADRVGALRDRLSKKRLSWNLEVSEQKQDAFLRDKLQSWNATPAEIDEMIRMAKEATK